MGNRIRAAFVTALAVAVLVGPATLPGTASEPVITPIGTPDALDLLDDPGVFRATVPDGWNGVATGEAYRLSVDAGEWIFEDLIYDDTGGDSSGARSARGTQWGLVKPKGDYVYPNDWDSYRHNAADLAELRLRRRGDTLDVLVRLNTMTAPDLAVAALAFGPADSADGAPHAWPLGANVVTNGTTHVLTVWGTGGAVNDTSITDLGGSVSVDVERNTIVASIPIAAIGGADRYTLYAGTGLWDSATGSWKQAAATASDTAWGHGGSASLAPPGLFDLAFGGLDGSVWSEQAQADAIDAVDLSGFVAQVDLAAVDTSPAPAPGVTRRVYRTLPALPGAEGVAASADREVVIRGLADYQGPATLNFLGPDEVSEVYVPEQPVGVLLYLHGGGGKAGGNVDQPGIIQTLGDDLRLAMVSPVGRGPNGQWTDEAYLAGWDAARDLVASLGLSDDAPIYVMGVSMGGLGTLRMATTMPDRFLTAMPMISNTGDDIHNEDPETNALLGGNGPNGNPQNLLVNLRTLPLLYVHGTNDQLEPYVEIRNSYDAMVDLGHRARLQSLIGLDHVAPVRLDQWDEMAQFIRDYSVTRPAPTHLTFTMSESWWRPDLGMVFDGTEWLGGLRVRDTADGFKSLATIDAVTHGLGEIEPAPIAEAIRPGANLAPSTVEGQTWGPVEPAIGENRLELDLTNVASIHVDWAAAGLDACHDLAIDVRSDGDSLVVLASVDAAAVSGADAAAVAGGVAVTVHEGDTAITVSGCTPTPVPPTDRNCASSQKDRKGPPPAPPAHRSPCARPGHK